MANLTLTIDDELLRKARMRAVAENTSVNALVREYLTRYATQKEKAERAIAVMDEIAERYKPSSGGRKWTRDELYDRSDDRNEQKKK